MPIFIQSEFSMITLNLFQIWNKANQINVHLNTSNHINDFKIIKIEVDTNGGTFVLDQPLVQLK